MLPSTGRCIYARKGSNVLLLLTLTYLVLQVTDAKGAEQPVSQILDTMFAQYDKAVRPYYGEKAVDVRISIYVLSFQKICESNMEFTLMMYLRQSWTDPRLVFRPNRGINRNGSNNTVYIDENRVKSLWIPDTYIVNEKKTLRHSETSVNEFVRVNSSGSVLKSGRYTVTLSCPMDLRMFPFDRQTCGIEIESFAGTMGDIRYQLDNDSISESTKVSLPDFTYVGFHSHNIQTTDNLKTGIHSRVSLQFVFQRSFASYLMRCYVPVGAACTISLLSLILANPVVGPIIHVVNICFVAWFSIQNLQANAPMKYSVKSLDVYFLICIAHIFLCLVGSLAESYRQRNQGVRANTVCKICKPLTELDTYRNQNQSQSGERFSCNGGKIIFFVLKLTIPILFFVFNIGYWLWIRFVTRGIEQLDADLKVPIDGY